MVNVVKDFSILDFNCRILVQLYYFLSVADIFMHYRHKSICKFCFTVTFYYSTDYEKSIYGNNDGAITKVDILSALDLHLIRTLPTIHHQYCVKYPAGVLLVRMSRRQDGPCGIPLDLS